MGGLGGGETSTKNSVIISGHKSPCPYRGFDSCGWKGGHQEAEFHHFLQNQRSTTPAGITHVRRLVLQEDLELVHLDSRGL